eukprot:RCo001190
MGDRDEVEELIGDDDDERDSYDEDMEGGGRELELEGADPANDYLLLEVLDGEEGSGSVVFRAQSKEQSSVNLAIKVLEFGENAEQAFAALNSELIALIQLGVKNPHVLKCLTAHVRDSSLWIVNEYCEGGSALDAAAVLRGLTEPEVRALVCGAVQALASLNEQKLLHGNLKASNLLISEEGSVKVADFGQLGQLKNTTAWLSPEAVDDKGKLTDRSDVWSLGITCFELAEFTTPYEGLSPEECAEQIISGPIPTLPHKDKARTWSKAFKDFVARCLTRDATARPSPKELLQDPFLKALDPEETTDILTSLVDKYLLKRDKINEWARKEYQEAGQDVASLPLGQYKEIFFGELADNGGTLVRDGE